jgi:hypothetical protein
MSDETGALTVNFGVLEFSAAGFSANFDSRTPARADDTDIAGIVRGAFEREGISLKSVNLAKCHHHAGRKPACAVTAQDL